MVPAKAFLSWAPALTLLSLAPASSSVLEEVTLILLFKMTLLTPMFIETGTQTKTVLLWNISPE